MEILEELKQLINILVAVILGFAIGYERKLRFKEAGIRTHTIVCAGSALMMVVSKYAFGEQEADASRVAAQIVSGIGFLGAGIIMFRGQKMHGLTTAAGIWATAGVGMAAGAGMYIVAIGSAIVIISVQCICHITVFKYREQVIGNTVYTVVSRNKKNAKATAFEITKRLIERNSRQTLITESLESCNSGGNKQ